MAERGLSQSALARTIGVTQGAIAKIATNNPNGSSKLHLLARALGTTPAYLTGETHDPDEGAPQPQPQPTVQHIMMPVALPAQPALEAMFQGLLRSMPGLEGDALAHELSKLLPIGLRQLRGPLHFVDLGSTDDDGAMPAIPAAENRGRLQGSRK